MITRWRDKTELLKEENGANIFTSFSFSSLFYLLMAAFSKII